MRRKIVAGNWKMNGGVAFAHDYFDLLKLSLSKLSLAENVSIIVAPPAVLLSEASRSIDGSSIELSAQNVSAYEKGAYTGEVSASMLSEVSCDWCLVGHSERRALFAETDADIVEKIKQLLACNIKPILCVGETLAQRESGKAESVVAEQISAVFSAIDESQLFRVVIAYEPVWAIGTGKTATPEQAQAMHKSIRRQVSLSSKGLADDLVILYGGSVNAENADTLFAQEDIDGALVGGASLKVEDFSLICKQMAESK